MADTTNPGATQDADRIRRLIDQSADSTDLESLRRRGFTQVRVIDERRIRELVTLALEEVIAARSQEHLSRERLKLSEDAMDEFREMMQEHQDSVTLRQTLESTKSQIEEEYQSIAARISDKLGRGEGEQAVEDLRGQFAKLMGLLQDKDGLLAERTAELGRAKRKMAKALEQIADRERELQALKDEGKEQSQGHQALQAELDTLRREKQALAHARDDAATLVEKLRLENRQYAKRLSDTEQRLITLDRQARERAAALESEREALEASLKAAQSDHQRLEAAHGDDHAKTQHELERLRAHLRADDERGKALDEHLTAARRECEEHSRRAQDLDAQLDQANTRAERAIARATEMETRLRHKEERLDQAQERLARYRGVVEDLEGTIEGVFKNMERMRDLFAKDASAQRGRSSSTPKAMLDRLHAVEADLAHDDVERDGDS